MPWKKTVTTTVVMAVRMVIPLGKAVGTPVVIAMLEEPPSAIGR
jgi:hypothetical protein